MILWNVQHGSVWVKMKFHGLQVMNLKMMSIQIKQHTLGFLVNNNNNNNNK